MKKGYFDKNDEQWIIRIPDEYGNPLNLHKNRAHAAKDKNNKNKKLPFEVKRLVWGQQSDAPRKIIVLEEIEWKSNKKTELRLAYYTTSKTGHWWWGQFALMIPKPDFKELCKYGREKGLLPF